MIDELVIKGLLCRSTRHWGPTQFRRFHNFFSPKIGIEVEWKTLNDAHKPTLPQGWECSWGPNVSSFGYERDYFAGEYTRLYDLRNPAQFIKTIYNDWEVHIPENHIPLMGSLHINHMVEREKIFAISSELKGEWLNKTSTKSNRFSAKEKLLWGRLENKRGLASYLPEDIMVQFMLSQAMVYDGIRGSFNGKSYMVINEIVKNVYPKGRRLLSTLNFGEGHLCPMVGK